MSSNPPLDDVANYLASVDSLGLTLGTNFFISLMPDSPDQVTALYEYPGAEPDYVMGEDNPALEETRFQVVVRDVEANYAANQTAIWAVNNAIKPVTNMTLGGTLYLRWQPLHSPSFYHRDEKRRIHHLLNFYTLRTPT